jgi:outer membrane protein assembly factor BamB
MSRLAFTLLLFALALPSTVMAADWPQFHSDAARTGFAADETSLDPSNVGDLTVRWSTQIAGVIASAVVVAEGSVFAGSDDGRLYALDRRNGTVLWTGETGAGIRHAPAVAGGRVYVGSEDAVFYAFPTSCATPCAPLWTRPLAGRPSSAPAVVGDVVYVGTGSGASGEVLALDGASGTVVWRGELSSSPAGVAVADSVVYASGPVAFPASCATPCAPLWFGSFGGAAPPAVSGGFLYVDAGHVNNRFNAYSTACAFSCFPVWFGATAEGTHRNAAAIADGQVFLAQDQSELSAFPVTGCSFFCLPTWTVQTGGFLSSAAVANGVVYVGAHDSMRAFDAATGIALATVPTGDATLSPAIADGSIYVSTLGFAAGGRVLRLSLPSSDRTPPAITTPEGIEADATSPDGAAVTYVASALDDVDGPVAVECSPASGDTFPIGTTQVTCSASDAAGNETTASFDVHVKGAGEQLDDLVARVAGLGPGSALSDMLVEARIALDAADDTGACEKLNAFANAAQAQSGKKLTAEKAGELVSSANRIRSVLDC